jgi:Delta3-Delta2-enoyl-CoA isomerase
LRMNRPKQLNGWTFAMMTALREAFEEAASDPSTGALVLTGTGKYYCAGVNLSATFKPQHPRKLHAMIRTQNQQLFDLFLDCPKPILAAVNGPAIGASVTSATLSDALLASDAATFSTPFARLGVPPEGCSSVNFERFMGRENAERMMGAEAWVPTAEEAVEIGLATAVVPGGEAALAEAAQEMAEQWIAEGKTRALPHGGGDALLARFKEVNAEESALLADAFTSEKFLEGQRAFLSSKGKTVPAMVFTLAKLTRPLWGMLLPPAHDKNIKE